MNLVYKNERALFAISLVFSLLFWLLIVVGTLGIALIYLLVGAIVYAFAQSAFISYIKGGRQDHAGAVSRPARQA